MLQKMQLALALAAPVLWLFSMALPVVQQESVLFEWGPPDIGIVWAIYSVVGLLFSPEIFFIGTLPNILMLIGSGAMFLDRHRASAICGGIAFLGAIFAGIGIAEDGTTLSVGYWVWIGSFLALLVAGVWGAARRFP
ncbi:MAG: hypothetical protein HY531_02650 [Chloroflexi bacterium]|nr:hypothetical protein [Chloroflexota bacterium]